ncbi:MAG: hypothetical protein ACKPFK_20845, partial [Dolichospermum sp.]
SLAVNAPALKVTPWTALLGRTGEAIFSSLSPVILIINAGVLGGFGLIAPTKSVVRLVISFFSVAVSVLESKFRVLTFPFYVRSTL